MRSVVDVRGKRLDFERAPQRVVSLVPSITESLHDLGAGSSLVGLTTYCIFPEQARHAAVDVGGTKNPSVDRIRELNPDLVLMNLEENLRRHADEIEAFAPLHVSEPRTVDDAGELLLQLGSIFEREERASELAAALAAARAGLHRLSPQAFRFACPIWKDPWMWCGADTYVSALVAEAGGGNVCSEQRYPSLSLEEVLSRKPEVIFLPDEPYVFCEDDASALRSAGVEVVGPFPGHLFTWHGTRTTKGLGFLRGVMLERRDLKPLES